MTAAPNCGSTKRVPSIQAMRGDPGFAGRNIRPDHQGQISSEGLSGRTIPRPVVSPPLHFCADVAVYERKRL